MFIKPQVSYRSFKITNNNINYYLWSLCHLDYGDILYHQGFNSYFHNSLESVKYNACFAITGAIRGTSKKKKKKKKLDQELDLEFLRLWRCYRKLCLFYKIFKNQHPKYLFHLITVRHVPYTTRNMHNLPTFKSKQCFEKLFFPVYSLWME